jgi:hypothetical protein
MKRITKLEFPFVTQVKFAFSEEIQATNIYACVALVDMYNQRMEKVIWAVATTKDVRLSRRDYHRPSTPRSDEAIERLRQQQEDRTVMEQEQPPMLYHEEMVQTISNDYMTLEKRIHGGPGALTIIEVHVEQYL